MRIKTKTMALHTILVSFALGSGAQAGPLEQHALSVIEQAGGKFWPHPDTPEGTVRSVQLVGDAATVEVLTALSDLNGVERLDLRHATINRDGFAAISKLTSLEELVLENVVFSPEDVPSFDSLANLRNVSLADCTVSHDLLDRLSEVPALTDLNLKNCPVTDQSLQHIEGLAGLQSLGLGGTQITDAGLATVAKFQHLRRLCIDHTSVTTVGINYLKGLPRLEYLALWNSPAAQQMWSTPGGEFVTQDTIQVLSSPPTARIPMPPTGLRVISVSTEE